MDLGPLLGFGGSVLHYRRNHVGAGHRHLCFLVYGRDAGNLFAHQFALIPGDNLPPGGVGQIEAGNYLRSLFAVGLPGDASFWCVLTRSMGC